MRAILLQLCFLFAIPMTFVYPHIGVLIYYWFTWFNPHRLVWGLLPIDWGKVIAGATILFLFLTKESKRLPANSLVVVVIMFFGWTTITTIFAKYPDPAFKEYTLFAKTIIMMLLATILINSKARLHCLVWIVCISIGFFGVRGGLFTALSGGNHYVYGPPKTHIFNTNEIARAFLMTLPLLYYLSIQSYHKYVRWIVTAVMLLTVLGLFGTTSRTAFLALVIVLFFGWLRSKSKIKLAIAGVLAGVVLLVAMPEARYEALVSKYSTSAEYKTDGSFQNRVDVWSLIVEDLSDKSPVVGGGFKAVVNEYQIEPHNSYFQVLGEHGYVGLLLYLLLAFFALLKTNKIYSMTKRDPVFGWAKDLALMLQLSLLAYFLGGVTKNHAFFEFFYMLVGMTVILEEVVLKEMREKKLLNRAIPAMR